MAFEGLKRKIVFWGTNHLFVGAKRFDKKQKLLNWIGNSIGEGTRIVGPVYCTGTLIVGKNCWIGKNLIVNGNGVVEIGDNCDIAPEVTFLTGGHEIGNAERRAGKGEKYTIHVGSGTWIGARATLGRDVKVGSGCVVAACACVVRDVEDNCLVGGVPAKVIRKLDD